MSLLITSNYQDEYSSKQSADPSHKINQGTPIQKASFYSNHLRNPVKIPPNSEIAVQSVKINRLPVYDIMPGNRFHWYLGDALEDKDGIPQLNISETLSIPIPATIKPGVYTQETFRGALDAELSRCTSMHPNYYNKSEVLDKIDANGKYEGFTYNFNQVDLSDATNYGDKLATWQGYHSKTAPAQGAGEYSITPDATNKKTTIKRLKDDGLSSEMTIINTDAPMELGKGLFEIDLWDAYGKTKNTNGNAQFDVKYYEHKCSFFLTSPALQNGSKNPFLAPGNSDSSFMGFDFQGYPADEVSFGDYRVDWNEKLDGSGYALQLSQAIWDDEAGGIVMREIEYWSATGDAVSAQVMTSGANKVGDDTTKPGTSCFVGKLKVEFKNTGIKLSMAHYDHTTKATTFSKVICDTTKIANRTKHEYIWTPINQNKWALYLGVSQASKDHTTIINTLNWNDGLRNGFKYGTGVGDGTSWWSQAQYNETTRNMELCKNLASRENQKMKQNSVIHWRDLSADADALLLSRALITQQPKVNTGLTESKGLYYPAFGANMGDELGFPFLPAITSTQMGVQSNKAGGVVTTPSFKWSVSSSAVPTFAVHSAFIKCPNLTAQSYNFCKSIPSQILYHIPRFSNEGREHGDLFFEVKDRCYIDLKNVDVLNLNQMDVQIVDKNEQLAGDLTGNTTIVFHIRQR
tara:strand:- start:559 stop:2628 length:2070 start_codon:yes stop_codon:yes gene_type:complete